MTIDELDEIFSQYGYELAQNDKNCRVYLLQQGMYYGAEIVEINCESDYSMLSKQYSDLGYAVKKHKFNCIEDAENYLFDGFFKTSLTSNRIHRRYQEFSDTQVRHFGDSQIKYEYIKVPYKSIVNGEFINGENIIDDVTNIIKQKGAYLVLIEASAGFGKTCTAFELYKSLEPLSERAKPLFAELTKNRDAKRFKYVLWSEIESEFKAGINTDLVIYNIRKGRIPLIIDGFDELLSKNIDSGNKTKSINEFDEVETMLSTIGDLLQENAKVILTSRKTAIFAGEQFAKWVESYGDSFYVTRFQLEKPEIKHWLTSERIDLLKANNVPLCNISNPVLLTYIRNIDDSKFSELVNEPDKIIDKYFTFLLERERERQKLLIPVEDQMLIYQKLAKSFSDFGISGDERSFVKDLISDENKFLIEKYRNLYSPKLSVDELTNTLVNHALLDRFGKNDYIGFINDFVFGILLGKSIIIESEFECVSEDALEKVVFAFAYANEVDKRALYNKLQIHRSKMPYMLQIKIDAILNKNIIGEYKNLSINSLDFSNIFFDGQYCNFQTSIFKDVTFHSCIFDKDAFIECSFIGCIFINCKIIDETKESEVYCFGCEDYFTHFITAFTKKNQSQFYGHQSIDYDKIVMSKYFKVDGKSPKMKLISVLKEELSDIDPSILAKVFHSLIKNGYILVNGNNSHISKSGISYYNNLR